MILLLVLALLGVFSLLIITFMLSTNHLRRGAEAMSDVGDLSVDEGVGNHNAREYAQMAGTRLLVGSPLSARASVLVNHSILENLYGHPNYSGFDPLSGSLATTDGTFLVTDQILAIPLSSVALPDGGNFASLMTPDSSSHHSTLDLMGNVLTFTESNRSVRIVYIAPSGSVPPQMLRPVLRDNSFLAAGGELQNDLMILSGDFRNMPNDRLDFIINGSAFGGTGMGYDPDATITPGSPVLTSQDGDAVPYALRPNPAAPSTNNNPEYTDFLRDNVVRMNVDYTAPDLNAMFLAHYELDAAAKLQRVISSFHRPDLVRFWRNHGPGMTTDLLRKIVMRPLPFDHPGFTGDNPTLAISALDGDDADAIAGSLADILSQDMAAGGSNAVGDVDNDGDTFSEGYWIDAGLPVFESEGKEYKPLVSYTVRELDGRVHLNAHGNPVYDSALQGHIVLDNGGNLKSEFDGDATLDTLVLPGRGEGSGPAEIRLDTVLNALGFPNAFNRLLNGTADQPGRYGDETTPTAGIMDRLYLSVALSPQLPYYEIPALMGYPLDGVRPGDTGSFRGTFPDLFGYGKVGYDYLGNRAYMPAAWLHDHGGDYSWGIGDLQTTIPNPYAKPGVEATLPTLFANPYLIDPNDYLSPADRPFTPAEFESLLRIQDFDATALPPRLLELLSNQTGSDIGNSTIKMQTLRKLMNDTTAVGNDIPTPAGFLGPDAPSIYSQVLKCVDNHSDNALGIVQRLPSEILEGRRVDLNRVVKDGTVASYNSTTYRESLKRRSKFAEEIFILLLVLSHDRLYGDPANGVSPYTEPGLDDDKGLDTPDKKRQWMITRLAQWSINLVDYLDPDDASTPLVFDLDPFGPGGTPGWSQRADTSLFLDGDPNVLNAVKTGQDENGHYINLVWGMERPKILISETMAMHDRKTADSDQEDDVAEADRARTDATDPQTPDADFDQVGAPVASLIVE
ncbi:MAG TPA: hypothetical protein DEB39_14410, partial [Planctomycetaceae bacterium]|nr:hypothetical protein [Planctomycetaceae bacterium]